MISCRLLVFYTDLYFQFYRNRVLQHFTCNPLKAFTGKITEPLFKVHYVLKNNEHNS